VGESDENAKMRRGSGRRNRLKMAEKTHAFGVNKPEKALPEDL
jgi:hypothetical protein